MKLRNLKMNESIEKQYSNALENDRVVLNPTEGNALEVEKARKEIIKDDFKEQDKVADEVAKATNATEVNEPKKVKDRKELSKLLAEAKEAGKQYKISRCNEEGFRYLFETIETEATKEPLNEDVTITVNPEEIKINDGVEDVAVIPTEGSEEEKKEEEVESEEVIEPIEECSKTLTEETNMQKIMRVLGMAEQPVEEALSHENEDYFDFTSELYHAIVDVLKEYKHKGVTKDDMQAALNFIDVHMDDDEDLAFLDSNAEADSASEEEAEEADWHKDIKDGDIVTADEDDEIQEESLNEEFKKSAGTILNDHQDEWGSATSPDQMRQMILKLLDAHKDEMDEQNYNYAKMSFTKASRNAIYGLVTAFTTGMAMSPNKQHKQNVKDLESESLQESRADLEKIQDALTDVESVEEEPKVEEQLVETSVEDEDELPFEEEKTEYEVDDEFDWKY